MTLDRQTSSTLDVDGGPFSDVFHGGGTPYSAASSTTARRPMEFIGAARGMTRPRRLPATESASAAEVLIALPDRGTAAASIDLDVGATQAAYDVADDADDLRRWTTELGVAAWIDAVARRLGAAFDRRPRVRLAFDGESPGATVVLVVPTTLNPDDAIERLLTFTESDWWLSVQSVTAGNLVVDVDHI